MRERERSLKQICGGGCVRTRKEKNEIRTAREKERERKKTESKMGVMRVTRHFGGSLDGDNLAETKK